MLTLTEVNKIRSDNDNSFPQSPRNGDIQRLLDSHEELRVQWATLRTNSSRQEATIKKYQREVDELKAWSAGLHEKNRALEAEAREPNRYDPGYWRGFMDASRIISSLPQREALDTAVQGAQRRLVAELNATVWGK